MPKTTPTHGGARKGAGRKRTSPGWATISIKVPAPTRDAFQALPEATRLRVVAEMRALVERAIE